MFEFNKKVSFEEYFKISTPHSQTVSEAELVTKIYDLGETPFIVSSIKDAYIKKMIQSVADRLGKTYTELEALVQHAIDEEIKDKHSKLLNETQQKNAVENVLYNILDSYGIDFEDAPKFSKMMFKELFDLILVEHKNFFPLKTSAIEKNRKNISPTLNFLPKSSKFKTAAIDDKATIYINEHFMQQLITFAWLKGLKPTGNKYQSHGGVIPDYYGYVEFVILHELLHYVYDEMYYTKKHPEYKHLINIAGDFRINYALVKSGYEQIPLGLFSDHLNLDRQKDYLDLLVTIDTEMKKYPQKLKSHDSHKNPNEDKNKQPQEDMPKEEAPKQPFVRGQIVTVRASNRVGFVVDEGTHNVIQKDDKETITQKMKIEVAEEKTNISSIDATLVERFKQPSTTAEVNGVKPLQKGDVIKLKSGESGIVKDISKQDVKGVQKLHMDIIPDKIYKEVINVLRSAQ